MSFSKSKGGARVVVVALAVLMAIACAQTASAETIFLTCNENYAGTAIFTVDLANSTVNNHPATINPTAIDWQTPIAADATGHITSSTTFDHIDRTAGTITEYATYHWASGLVNSSRPQTYPCTVGSPPPTKF
jgi:hypothetical protein